MRKLSILGGLILFAAVPAMAQDYPKGEVGGNYTYVRIYPGGSGAGSASQNCQGGGGSVAWNLNQYFGVAGEFAGCKVTGLTAASTPNSAHAFTYLFGPRLTARGHGGFEPFAEALFGGARFSATFTNPAPPPTNITLTKNGFAMALGGGADYKVGRSFAIRLIQADYLYTRINYGGTGAPTHQNNFRIQAGVTFRFGGR